MILNRVVRWAILQRIKGERVSVLGSLGIPLFSGKPVGVLTERAEGNRTRFLVVIQNSHGMTERVDYQDLAWNRLAGQWETTAQQISS